MATVLGGAVLASVGLSACYVDTQRYTGILKPLETPLPEGVKSTFPRGPEEAYVIRHADPVSVRTAETMSVVKMRYYDKRTRVPAGSWIYSGAKGHAEVLLGGSTSITLRGNTSGVVGSASRREPAFILVEVERATIIFGELGLVELPGGALLESSSGPFVVERVQDDVLRVRNRCSEPGVIAYREERINLEPSEVVDLPLLEVGTAPFEIDPAARNVLTGGGRIELRGSVDVLGSRSGTRLRAAAGESEITGSGLILRLEPGDEVLFEGLGESAPRRGNVPAPPLLQPPPEGALQGADS